MARTTAVQVLLLVACMSLFISPALTLRHMLKADTGCEDDNDECEGWANTGECSGRFAEYMKIHCPKSCKITDCSESSANVAINDYTEGSDDIESESEEKLTDSFSINEKDESLRMEVESEVESKLEEAEDDTKASLLTDADLKLEDAVEKVSGGEGEGEDEDEDEIDKDDVDISEYETRPLPENELDDEAMEKEQDVDSLEDIDSDFGAEHSKISEENEGDHHHSHDDDDDAHHDDDDAHHVEDDDGDDIGGIKPMDEERLLDTGCVDLTDKCKIWYEKGSCTADIEGEFVREVCPKSCMVCNKNATEQTGSEEVTGSETKINDLETLESLESEDTMEDETESKSEVTQEDISIEVESSDKKPTTEIDIEAMESSGETNEGSTENEEDKECEDTEEACADWFEQGQCDGKFAELMKKKCPKSCGLCSQKTKSDCTDKDEKCAEWAERGECDGRFAELMIKKCAVSCKTC